MKGKKYKVLGLMSGSSLDGLDIAFCEFDIQEGNITSWQLLKAETIPFSQKWIERLLGLPFQNALVYAQTDTYFGYYMGELVNNFLQKHQIQPDFVASHGHTVFHNPEKRFTAQIGNGAALAATIRYPVISDFRTQDIAQNGEGAPVAPIADKLLFPEYDFFLNLGGIANLSCNANGKFIAFDIGGANQVLNALSNEIDLEYDEDGKIAATGKLNHTLFEQLNQSPYFKQSYPKSLSNQWVQETLIKAYFEAEDAIENLLHTACIQLAHQTKIAFTQILENEGLKKDSYKILVTGGGAFNSFLMKCLEEHCASLANLEWVIPDANIISFKEATLMALMGVLRMEGLPNCLSTVTGARKDSVGGMLSLF